MLRRGAAASADNPDAVVLDEVLVVVREVRRLELVDGVPAFVLRQAGVGKNRNMLARICPKEAHRIVHLDRPGGAIQSNDVDVERFQRGERSTDFSPQQHRSGSFKCYLNSYR